MFLQALHIYVLKSWPETGQMLGSPFREHLKQTRTPLGYTASILLDILMWHFEHALSSVTTTLLCISCTAKVTPQILGL